MTEATLFTDSGMTGHRATRRSGGLDRRHFLRGATIALAAGLAGAAARAQGGGRRAVVFLSRSGNTRVLAESLARRFDATLAEIRPREPWPADYDAMVAWASRWRESETLLPLEPVPDLAGRSSVFLGFPIWGGALPAPMRSFLAATDLSGRTVLPVVTHGGFGPGSALDELRRLAPAARFVEPFVLECDQERDNLNALGGWLDTVGADVAR